MHEMAARLGAVGEEHIGIAHGHGNRRGFVWELHGRAGIGGMDLACCSEAFDA